MNSKKINASELSKMMVVASLLLTTTSCGSGDKEVDEFYTRINGYDYARIPLVKPYEMLRLNGMDNWMIKRLNNKMDFGLSNVDSIAVIDSIIIGHSAAGSFYKGEKINGIWFSIIPRSYTERAFVDRDKLRHYTKQKGIGSIRLVAAETVFTSFEKHYPINWKSFR